jgi:excisionase family DNA binding protein
VNDIASLLDQHRGGMDAVEVAEVLGIPRKTVYTMAKANRIPSVKLGSKVIFDPARLAAWWRSKEVA